MDLKSNESSGKDIFITMPNRKIGYRALKLSVYIKFWTLYKGFCEICASPQWIEIYLKLLLFVQKHVQSIFVFIAGICIYEFLYLNII